jgi:hypothetical protein
MTFRPIDCYNDAFQILSKLAVTKPQHEQLKRWKLDGIHFAEMRSWALVERIANWMYGEIEAWVRIRSDYDSGIPIRPKGAGRPPKDYIYEGRVDPPVLQPPYNRNREKPTPIVEEMPSGFKVRKNSAIVAANKNRVIDPKARRDINPKNLSPEVREKLYPDWQDPKILRKQARDARKSRA